MTGEIACGVNLKELFALRHKTSQLFANGGSLAPCVKQTVEKEKRRIGSKREETLWDSGRHQAMSNFFDNQHQGFNDTNAYLSLNSGVTDQEKTVGQRFLNDLSMCLIDIRQVGHDIRMAKVYDVHDGVLRKWSQALGDHVDKIMDVVEASEKWLLALERLKESAEQVGDGEGVDHTSSINTRNFSKALDDVKLSKIPEHVPSTPPPRHATISAPAKTREASRSQIRRQKKEQSRLTANSGTTTPAMSRQSSFERKQKGSNTPRRGTDSKHSTPPPMPSIVPRPPSTRHSIDVGLSEMAAGKLTAGETTPAATKGDSLSDMSPPSTKMPRTLLLSSLTGGTLHSRSDTGVSGTQVASRRDVTFGGDSRKAAIVADTLFVYLDCLAKSMAADKGVVYISPPTDLHGLKVLTHTGYGQVSPHVLRQQQSSALTPQSPQNVAVDAKVMINCARGANPPISGGSRGKAVESTPQQQSRDGKAASEQSPSSATRASVVGQKTKGPSQSRIFHGSSGNINSASSGSVGGQGQQSKGDAPQQDKIASVTGEWSSLTQTFLLDDGFTCVVHVANKEHGTAQFTKKDELQLFMSCNVMKELIAKCPSYENVAKAYDLSLPAAVPSVPKRPPPLRHKVLHSADSGSVPALVYRTNEAFKLLANATTPAILSTQGIEGVGEGTHTTPPNTQPLASAQTRPLMIRDVRGNAVRVDETTPVTSLVSYICELQEAWKNSVLYSMEVQKQYETRTAYVTMLNNKRRVAELRAEALMADRMRGETPHRIRRWTEKAKTKAEKRRALEAARLEEKVRREAEKEAEKERAMHRRGSTLSYAEENGAPRTSPVVASPTQQQMPLRGASASSNLTCDGSNSEGGSSHFTVKSEPDSEAGALTMEKLLAMENAASPTKENGGVTAFVDELAAHIGGPVDDTEGGGTGLAEAANGPGVLSSTMPPEPEPAPPVNRQHTGTPTDDEASSADPDVEREQ